MALWEVKYRSDSWDRCVGQQRHLMELKSNQAIRTSKEKKLASQRGQRARKVTGEAMEEATQGQWVQGGGRRALNRTSLCPHKAVSLVGRQKTTRPRTKSLPLLWSLLTKQPSAMICLFIKVCLQGEKALPCGSHTSHCKFSWLVFTPYSMILVLSLPLEMDLFQVYWQIRPRAGPRSVDPWQCLGISST